MQFQRFEKLQKYYLNTPVDPAIYKQGDSLGLIDSISLEECENGGGGEPTTQYYYRYILSEETVCKDTNLYSLYIKQQSITPSGPWENVSPIIYNFGPIIKENYYECGGTNYDYDGVKYVFDALNIVHVYNWSGEELKLCTFPTYNNIPDNFKVILHPNTSFYDKYFKNYYVVNSENVSSVLTVDDEQHTIEVDIEVIYDISDYDTFLYLFSRNNKTGRFLRINKFEQTPDYDYVYLTNTQLSDILLNGRGIDDEHKCYKLDYDFICNVSKPTIKPVYENVDQPTYVHYLFRYNPIILRDENKLLLQVRHKEPRDMIHAAVDYKDNISYFKLSNSPDYFHNFGNIGYDGLPYLHFWGDLPKPSLMIDDYTIIKNGEYLFLNNLFDDNNLNYSSSQLFYVPHAIILTGKDSDYQPSDDVILKSYFDEHMDGDNCLLYYRFVSDKIIAIYYEDYYRENVKDPNIGIGMITAEIDLNCCRNLLRINTNSSFSADTFLRLAKCPNIKRIISSKHYKARELDSYIHAIDCNTHYFVKNGSTFVLFRGCYNFIVDDKGNISDALDYDRTVYSFDYKFMKSDYPFGTRTDNDVTYYYNLIDGTETTVSPILLPLSNFPSTTFDY